MIHTSACRILGIVHPVVQAGMGGGANPALVAAVTRSRRPSVGGIMIPKMQATVFVAIIAIT
jgi:NAD(P)H-dependent flavin oxidoreductase YrpB (nitropropane dioxygenase family)